MRALSISQLNFVYRMSEPSPYSSTHPLHPPSSTPPPQHLEEQQQRALQDEAKSLEKLLNDRNVCAHKRDDVSNKIRDLGSLPSAAYDK